MELLRFVLCVPIHFLLLFTFSYPQEAMSSSHNNYTDLESLLAFKAGVADPYGFLATNWTTEISFCSWAGVRCSPMRQRVVALKLVNFSLQGTISPHLGNLSFLSYLNLRHNFLTGSLPHMIAKLPRLATFDINSNKISGLIPPSIFNMSTLVRLHFSANSFSGSLPLNRDQFMLPRLKWLSLSDNNLIGNIPPHFSACSGLISMSLAFNNFTGAIPPEFGNITELTYIVMGHNKLTGSIPASIGNLTKLNIFSVGFNYLEGTIPEELGNLQNLQYLHLTANNLTGTIPVALSNASNIDFVEFAQNNLTGSIPTTLGKSWSQLTVMNMAENQLTGGLDFITSFTNCRYLLQFIAPGNQLEGTLPNIIGNLSDSVQIIDLSDNRIKGNIPAGFGNLSGLFALDLGANMLTGMIPSALSRLNGLQGLSLRRNRLSGSIPTEIGLMKSLSILKLSENTFSGPIPHSLGNISGLHTLTMDGNRLASNIPDSFWSLLDLIELNLSDNALDGLLQVGNLRSLNILDLSRNQFSGNISSTLGDLKMLSHLDLSKNSFSGQIPSSFKGLVNINYMNLSHNFLSGIIPKSLANLSHLDSLDLSFNKLEGQIPQGGIFSNPTFQSLEGNSALCGSVQLGFLSCSSNVAKSHSKSKVYLLKYIVPPLASIVVLLSFFLILLMVRSRSTESKSPSEVAPPNELRVVSYHELVRATENFSNANLLGSGSSSSVFKAYLDDGLITAVKVINLEVQGAEGIFDAECRTLSTVRHRNLLKIISTCSNLEFKALILEYMPNGSLGKWLYSPTYYLNLLQRINIIVDVSLALEYLHHYHSHTVVHRDLNPRNVLLDEDMVAHVGDFGIAKLLDGDNKAVLSVNAPGTIGYMPPEYGAGGNVSSKGDVYSFGILLLETFTGKMPTDAMFVGELSLKKWVSIAYPDTVLEIADPKLFRENSTDIVRRCLLSVIELGMLCSRDSPKERLPISDIVPMLQKIKMEYESKYLQLEASTIC